MADRLPRRALRLTGAGVEVGREVRFDSEEQLHRAIADHPEVLPAEDIGLGPLVRLAEELDLGHGPLDLLAVDPSGRLVVIEFKRGTENSDVRKVIAQMLDYGSRLWRLPYDDLQRHALAQARLDGEPPDDLPDLVRRRLDGLGAEGFDADAFKAGVARHLEDGDFVYLYVARDLDDRTRAVMTYLADGVRLSFFAVEVDRFLHDDGSSVLVPRTAFTPAWAAVPARPGASPIRAVTSLDEELTGCSHEFQEAARLVQRLAEEVGAVMKDKGRGRHLCADGHTPDVSLYLSDQKVWLDMRRIREEHPDRADAFVAELAVLVGHKVAPIYPALRAASVVTAWPQVEPVLRRYIEARRAVAGRDGRTPAAEAT